MFLLSVDANAVNNCGFTPLLFAVYLGQHIAWKHAFGWSGNSFVGQKKVMFNFFASNKVTGKYVLHYAALNAMLIIILDRLCLGDQGLELDANMQLPSYYVPQGHITCKKCLLVIEKEQLIKAFYSICAPKSTNSAQDSLKKSTSIRPVLRLGSKINELGSNYNKFAEHDNKIRADLSFNFNKKKLQDPDELFKGLADIPSSSIHRIPLMPSDSSKKIPQGSLRRSETEHDMSLSRLLNQNSFWAKWSCYKPS
jgi:hypothetical protein